MVAPWAALCHQPFASWWCPSANKFWATSFKTILTNHHLFVRHIRYVDNRLVLGDPQIQRLPPYEVLLDDGFYGKPIVLETEPDQEFLGFMLETNPLELIYVGTSLSTAPFRLTGSNKG